MKKLTTQEVRRFASDARTHIYSPHTKTNELADGGREKVWGAIYGDERFLFRQRTYGEDPSSTDTTIFFRRVHEKGWRTVWAANTYGMATDEYRELERSSEGVLTLRRVKDLVRRAGEEGLVGAFQKGGVIIDEDLKLSSELDISSDSESFKGEVRVELVREFDTSPLLYLARIHGGRIR